MLLDLLELASNRTLDYDPESLARLSKLRGKTMVLTVKPLNQSLAVTPQQEGLEFSRQLPERADVTLRVTLNALLKISRDGLDDAELETGELEMEGDPIIGQRFARVIAELDIDWNALLSDQIGEAPAQFVQLATAQAFEAASGVRSSVKQLTKRLLQEDLGLVATADEVNSILDDIDDLRAAADRLKVRIDRLTRTVE